MVGRTAKLRAVAVGIKKQCGKRSIGSASIRRGLTTKHYTSGSLSMDFVLGGGPAKGHILLIAGDESSGKSTTSLRIIGDAQGECANCGRKPDDLVSVCVQQEEYDKETGEVTQEAIYEAQATCDCFQQRIFRPSERSGETKDEYKARLAGYVTNSFEETRCALIDVEGTFDHAWARRLGVDPDRLEYVIPDSAEEACDIYDTILRTGAVDVICMDSIAALTPTVEIEASMEDQQRAAGAKLVNKWVRKAGASANAVARDIGRAPTQIWINQLRTDLNIKYGSKDMLPNGRAQRFAASVILTMWSGGWETEDMLGDTREKKDKKGRETSRGTEVTIYFRTIKNKLAPGHAQGYYKLKTAGPDAGKIDELDYVVQVAEKFDDIRKFKDKFVLMDEKFQRKGDLLLRLQEPAVWRRVKSLLLKRLMGEAG
jgi:RecA/RadA recombinase